MLYNYDPKKMNEYLISISKKTIPIIVFSFLWAMFMLFITLREVDNFRFVFLLTIIIGSLSIVFGFLFGILKNRNDYKKYTLEITDRYISINSNYLSRKIAMESIIRITKNKKEDICIQTKYNRNISLSKYLEKYEEVESKLNEIKQIEYTKNTNNLIQYIPFIFFCGLFLAKYIPDYRIYLILTSGFIITSIIGIIQLFQSQMKITKILLPLLLNIVLIVIVFRNILLVINRII
jgi:hypothetical protein